LYSTLAGECFNPPNLAKRFPVVTSEARAPSNRFGRIRSALALAVIDGVEAHAQRGQYRTERFLFSFS